LAVAEVEVMFLESSVGVEEAPMECFVQGAEEVQGRDLEVEVEHLTVSGCLQMEVVHRTCLPQAGPRLVLESSVAEEVVVGHLWHSTVLALGLVEQEVDSQTCRHLRVEAVPGKRA
jgi:hypothetical protein